MLKADHEVEEWTLSTRRRRPSRLFPRRCRRRPSTATPTWGPAHLLGALLAQTDGLTAPLLSAVGADPTLVRKELEQLSRALPSASGSTVSAPQLSRDAVRVLGKAQELATEMGDEYVSTEHLLVGLAQHGGQVADLLRRHGATPDALARGLHEGARLGAGDVARSRGHLQGAGEVRRRPDRTCPQGRARPGDRPRRRDPPRRPGAVPAHQEQPGADRRARRRQDRHRRGPRAARRGR